MEKFSFFYNILEEFRLEMELTIQEKTEGVIYFPNIIFLTTIVVFFFQGFREDFAPTVKFVICFAIALEILKPREF